MMFEMGPVLKDSSATAGAAVTTTADDYAQLYIVCGLCATKIYLTSVYDDDVLCAIWWCGHGFHATAAKVKCFKCCRAHKHFKRQHFHTCITLDRVIVELITFNEFCNIAMFILMDINGVECVIFQLENRVDLNMERTRTNHFYDDRYTCEILLGPTKVWVDVFIIRQATIFCVAQHQFKKNTPNHLFSSNWSVNNIT